jgi:hypothetical protein
MRRKMIDYYRFWQRDGYAVYDACAAQSRNYPCSSVDKKTLRLRGLCALMRCFSQVYKQSLIYYSVSISCL